jgi:hypothetical protein
MGDHHAAATTMAAHICAADQENSSVQAGIQHRSSVPTLAGNTSQMHNQTQLPYIRARYSQSLQLSDGCVIVGAYHRHTH